MASRAGGPGRDRGLLRRKGGCLIIADAKRGDIGNTARKYAEAFFDRLSVDALTIAPYMGRDSVTPFLGREGKWAMVLGVTSNEGALDFQFLPVDGQQHLLFERVMTKVAEWGSVNDTMFVVGATRTDVLEQARASGTGAFLPRSGCGCPGRRPAGRAGQGHDHRRRPAHQQQPRHPLRGRRSGRDTRCAEGRVGPATHHGGRAVGEGGRCPVPRRNCETAQGLTATARPHLGRSPPQLRGRIWAEAVFNSPNPLPTNSAILCVT